MNKFQFFCGLYLSAILFLALQPQQAAADCWNYVTGSRCDNEDFWKKFGYKSCNDNCKGKGYKSGRCENSEEKCGWLTRTVKVCKCHN
ncbi:hydramacin-1 [Ditylenchus destructor]|uniref:Hydramacin-1 n=1 Tax=Ditylenchus destructor TaxID=166010 RepID=A0AAD4QT96_9BILA|nr:hydramacin-1 [Ditylenchus destructor]